MRVKFFTFAVMAFCLFSLGGCGKASAANAAPQPTATAKPAPVSPKSARKDTGLDLSVLNTYITVEAGTPEITPSDFWKDTAEEANLTIVNPLSAEELRVAGAVYDVTLHYRHCSVSATVHVTDTKAPVLVGLSNITVNRGDSISYKRGVSVTDNSSEDIDIVIDNSTVNVDVGGTYTISYSASDSSGNTTKEWVTVTVLEPDTTVDESMVIPLLDEVISAATTPEMTKREKAYQLWLWCRQNLRYSETIHFTDYWTAAHAGLSEKKGDCYVFYAIYSTLLTRCEIENLCVRRVGGRSNHYWNLVHIEEGWYHCDTSPRKIGDPYKCILQTDAQLQGYTDFFYTTTETPNYFSFDPSQYPERGTEILYPNPNTDPPAN